MPNTKHAPFIFASVARVPALGDNVAIASQTLSAGDCILIRQLVFEFAHTILEGHRFALYRIRKGDALLSWGLPFGLALRDIEPGEYLCNEKILKALAERSVGFALPKAPNFVDHRLVFRLEETAFRPGEQVSASGSSLLFQGYRRNQRRGAGTRNYIVVLGASSRTAGFVRSLAARFKNIRSRFPNVDGVVPVDHTEGGSPSRPFNLELTLRTLAGFIVNPNVAAVLCVDFGNEVVSNASLRRYLKDHNYPVEGLLHEFFSIGSSFEKALTLAERKVESWLPLANRFIREPLPLRFLKLGLQCGGSDAFSGVSANPLVGLLSRDTVAFGGSANLAETDELIGAESYVLENVRDLATSKAFLEKIDRFQAWAGRHGHSAEGNPSGGNMYRGLYNITIKSIGAARKKDPATRLDYVIDYGEPMETPGFYFMNSPGNDLESIAGQVASGCNMILFATGNGSITNFPFVPTIKLMTTTRRFELVRNEMDFNAGRYLDGEPMEALGREAFDQMLRVASGEQSAGERAGHSQVQLWREWRGAGISPVAPASSVEPVLDAERTIENGRPGFQHRDGPHKNIDLEEPAKIVPAPLERLALVLPTSLCAGQIARLIVDQLNADPRKWFSRAVALPHTEGCGNSAGESEKLFLRTMAGYLAHPFVAKAVLLEHGCEKTHNDAFGHVLRDLGLDPANYGFASIQLDGGIERVTRKVLKQLEECGDNPRGHSGFSIAFVAPASPAWEDEIIELSADLFVRDGHTVVLPERMTTYAGQKLQYGQRFNGPGVHAMETPTEDIAEIITGLAATGVQMILVFNSESLVPGNPLVPTLQVASVESLPAALREDVDLLVSRSAAPGEIARDLVRLINQVHSGEKIPRSRALSNFTFQITRGYTGISL